MVSLTTTPCSDGRQIRKSGSRGAYEFPTIMAAGAQRMRAKLYRIIQPVSDIERAADFYADVLGTSGDRVSRGRHYFNCGGTILACYDPAADGDQFGDGWRHHPFQYFYFAVGDLERTLESVDKAGGVLETRIDTMPWGERLFYAKDPFGNPICFVDESTLFVGRQESSYGP